ncbi:polypeptide N-acetylgalactosaminyltransferase 14-like isoform X2 [Physella acuta]|uniref:polypeptide N-acetylgalactosaminyltransferase 14-like isoform X2 n=1 Tax=Physella acuta TaxID=109671 RepID=UPI0027DDFF5C|nr:polypeptide N-acetylgalactosaminyltransferase 14-like isoform X2 [Physella acuta]
MRRRAWPVVCILTPTLAVFFWYWTDVRDSIFSRSASTVSFDASILNYLKLVFEGKQTTEFGYNVETSRALQVDRSIPDTRHDSCPSRFGPTNLRLPALSVIVTAAQTDLSVVTRNLHSLLERAEHVPVSELILVHDVKPGSTSFSKVPGLKIIHDEFRGGRSLARLKGYAAATGDMIVFVDALTEMNKGWLLPLVVRLMESPNSIVTPVFDVIDRNTLEYFSLPELYRVGFDWSLQFHWEQLPFSHHTDPADTYRSPAMTGNVFAVTRQFFNLIGRYDVTPSVQGDLELSLRAWLCGGLVEMAPCSRVGLINIKSGNLGQEPTASFNSYLRGARLVAELWLGEYKRFFFAVRPSARMQPVAGLSYQRKVKIKLQCRTFQWFLSNIYPQLQPLVTDEVVYGHIKQGQMCIDLDPGQLPLVAKLRECDVMKDSQEWSWRRSGLIVSNGMCLTSDLLTMQGFVLVQFCKEASNQMWYRHAEKIVHADTNLCLDGTEWQTGVKVTDCIKGDEGQAWDIGPLQ